MIESEDVQDWEICAGTAVEKVFPFLKKTLRIKQTSNFRPNTGKYAAYDLLKALRVVLPFSFRGDLKMQLESRSVAKLDGWSGGNFDLTAHGASLVEAGIISANRAEIFSTSSAGILIDVIESRSSSVLEIIGNGGLMSQGLKTPSLLLCHCGRGNVIVTNAVIETARVIASNKDSTIVRGAIANLYEGTCHLNPLP